MRQYPSLVSETKKMAQLSSYWLSIERRDLRSQWRHALHQKTKVYASVKQFCCCLYLGHEMILQYNDATVENTHGFLNQGQCNSVNMQYVVLSVTTQGNMLCFWWGRSPCLGGSHPPTFPTPAVCLHTSILFQSVHLILQNLLRLQFNIVLRDGWRWEAHYKPNANWRKHEDILEAIVNHICIC